MFHTSTRISLYSIAKEMSSLSPNWKKLSSKFTSADGSIKKSSKLRNKRTRKIKEESLKDLASTNTVMISRTPESPTSIISSMEAVLWSYENEISKVDISKISNKPISISVKDNKKKDAGKYIAIDCEFVGVGPEGKESALARVSVVNFYGYVVYDKYVKPKEKVTDWRTWVSGITPKHMNEAFPFDIVQREVAALFEGRIIVGHAIHHDLEALFLSHPKWLVRDTSLYKPFRAISMGKTPSLKKLTLHFFEIEIQGAAHSSVEDARATMLLFRMHKKDFERSLKLVSTKK
ncbi:uncharacterized protein PRCAT00000901001 [Priceomyces carsonii]|uniref:uncharacterized protein n=1 Tax=Priceomyces carsonii TaxID=28549 RepID=UPI002EDB9DB9|nr:unnamed protein product [Priceomyces carsonii]